MRARHVQEWTVTLLDRYSDSYASNQFRALQQFFKWHATEDPDEPPPNPVATLKPPKVSGKLVPVFTGDELAAMLATCKGGGLPEIRIIYCEGRFYNTEPRQFDPVVPAPRRVRLREESGGLVLDLPAVIEATVPERPMRRLA